MISEILTKKENINLNNKEDYTSLIRKIL